MTHLHYKTRAWVLRGYILARFSVLENALWLMERDSAGFHESASKLKSKREILDVHFDLILSCLGLFLSL